MIGIQANEFGCELDADLLVIMALQIFQQRFEALAVDGVALTLIPLGHLLRREGTGQQGEE
ncbi:hypothetical protein D3C73_1280570 [compost metagenome]